MSKKQLTASFQSFILFMLSFLLLKILVGVFKQAYALYADIDTKLIAYNFIGVSPANSQVWTKLNVRIFYSIDFIILLITFILFTLKSFVFEALNNERRRIYFYLSFLSFVLMVSSVISGIITKKEFYHALNWFYLSYSSMLIIVILLLIVSLVYLLYIKEFFLCFLPDIESFSSYWYFFRMYGITVFTPIVLALGVVYLPYIIRFSLLDIVGIFFIIIVLLFGFIDLWRNKELEYIVTEYKRFGIVLSVNVFLIIIPLLLSVWIY